MKQLSLMLSVLILMTTLPSQAGIGSFIAQAYNRLVKVSANDVCKKIQFDGASACHQAHNECLSFVKGAQGVSQFNFNTLEVCNNLAAHRLSKNCEAINSCVHIAVEKAALSSEQAELCEQIAKSKNGPATLRCLQAELSYHLLPLCKDAAKWGHYSYANECIAAINGKTKEDISPSAAGICRVRAGSSAEIHMKGMITCIENAEVKTRGDSDVQRRVDEYRSSSAQQ